MFPSGFPKSIVEGIYNYTQDNYLQQNISRTNFAQTSNLENHAIQIANKIPKTMNNK